MKRSDIEAIISQHPEAVFTTTGGWPVVVVGFVTKKEWGNTRPTTKARVRYVHDDGRTSTETTMTPIKIVGLRATSITEHVALTEQQRAERLARRDQEAREREAREAARARATAALKDREEDVIAGLAQILGCKRDDITVSAHRGTVEIKLAGDVAVNIVDERAYCYE